MPELQMLTLEHRGAIVKDKISRLALKIVVMARQKARGKRQE
ncbi:hypothetical protein [Aphanizomenon flos-aquae]|nr:hypothetical protein [Aphanizomenon flos-aquae]